MKKAILFILLAFIALASVFAQTTRIVCNASGYNNGITNALVYNNLQTCITAADAGDIIYVQGSGISYGTIKVDKSIVLIGPGYYLGHNTVPNTQALATTAIIDSITFLSTASNSILKGFIVKTDITSDGASNIIIQNNNFGFVYLKNSSNCVIKQNYAIGVHSYWDVWINNANISVTNNIFMGAGTFMYSIVEHNVFNHDFSVYEHMSFYECVVKSNIIGNSGRCYDCSGCFVPPPCPAILNLVTNTTFVNNLFRADIFQLGSMQNTMDGNISNYFLDGTSTDGRFQLKQGSPAIGAGEGGTDCGAFGGTEPYKLSGIGFNPNIFKVEMPTTGTSQGGLPVKVLISANQ